MYFLMDAQLKTVKAFSRQGSAAKKALSLLGVCVKASSDPVKALFDHALYADRFLIITLSDAFHSISDSIKEEDQTTAVQLSDQLKKAVDDYYKKTKAQHHH